jgi:hypothetical protein
VPQQNDDLVKKTNGKRFWDRADLRKRIEFGRIGLDLPLQRRNRNQAPPLRHDQISQKDLDATISSTRKPHRRTRISPSSRAAPAHLHLRSPRRDIVRLASAN